MQVKELNNGIIDIAKAVKPTDRELQNEYNYMLSEELINKLFNKGLITDKEYEKIMIKNRRIFNPFLSKIMP